MGLLLTKVMHESETAASISTVSSCATTQIPIRQQHVFLEYSTLLLPLFPSGSLTFSFLCLPAHMDTAVLCLLSALTDRVWVTAAFHLLSLTFTPVQSETVKKLLYTHSVGSNAVSCALSQ